MTKEGAQNDTFVMGVSRVEETLQQKRLNDDPGGATRDDAVVPVLR